MSRTIHYLFIVLTFMITRLVAETMTFSSGILEYQGESGQFTANGSCFDYQSEAVTAGQYRWGRAKYPMSLRGDFTAELDWTASRLDRGTLFGLELRAKEPSECTVSLKRQKNNDGRELAICEIILGGVTQKIEYDYSGYQGTFRISRKDTAAVFSIIDSKGQEHILHHQHGISDIPLFQAAKFDCPASVALTVSGLVLRADMSEVPNTAYEPFFSSPTVIGAPHLLAEKDTQFDGDGSLAIPPGGKALFGFKAPLNIRNANLSFESQGALKLSAIQPGSSESIQLGHALIFDESPRHDTTPVHRQIALTDWLTRFAGPRNWNYPFTTQNNVLFFIVEPASDNETVIFRNFEFSASILQQPQAIVPEDVAIAHGDSYSSDGYCPLTWNYGQKWVDEVDFPKTEKQKVDGIPFHPCPTLLSPEAPSFGLQLNQTVGGIHLFHAAGKQPAGATPHLCTCQIHYEDGTIECIFIVLKWNCGVWSDEDMARGCADHTWWGPTDFPHAGLIPFPFGANNLFHHAIYHTFILNPHPEKNISRLSFFQMPGDTREYGLAGITIQSPETARISHIEPARATFAPGETISCAYLEYASLPPGNESIGIALKRPMETIPLDTVFLQETCHFRAALTDLKIPETCQPGPAILSAPRATSSLLGLLPPPIDGQKETFPLYTMICGGGESLADFERIARLGYDSVKFHVKWVEETEGEILFPGIEAMIARMHRAGLVPQLRPHVRNNAGSEVLQQKARYVTSYAAGKEPVKDKRIDPADDYARSAFVRFYREIARLCLRNNVFSINANYGLRTEVGVRRFCLGEPSRQQFIQELKNEFSTIEALNHAIEASFISFEDINAETIPATPELLKRFTRMHHRNLSRIQRDVVAAIREEGFNGLLIFNTSFHTNEQKMLGAPNDEYLRLGDDFTPASLFHETSDRYCLSFAKWMLAGRTFGHPFGDEGNQTPPTYGHNIRAYMWMAMMQACDANYCQWFQGKPASQNIAWLKPFHRLLYHAEYLPDPVCLAHSLQTGFEEAPVLQEGPLHKNAIDHFSLVNVLRQANINPDRYMVDDFPEKDAAVTSRLLIDDIVRAMPVDFGNRIEAFIRNGGTYLATPETDRLNDYAFLKRFGICFDATGQPAGDELVSIDAPCPAFIQSVGQGHLVIFGKKIGNGSYDTNNSNDYIMKMRDTLCALGHFSPNVTASDSILATPYRAPDGSLLIFCINLQATTAQATISWRNALAPGLSFRDMGTGQTGTAVVPGNSQYAQTQITMAPWSATLLKIFE